MKSRFILIILLFLIIALPVLSGCSNPENEGFGIYLTRDDVPPEKMEILSHVELAVEPVISTDDIISYDAQTHKVKLTEEAFSRISQLEVPTRGKSFLVCINQSPVYWGAFWVIYSSQSFDGITIWKQFGNQDTNTIKIELGYPWMSAASNKDPRNNPEVMKSLEKSGKLGNISAVTFIDVLPESMKGYELYSWQEDGQWHFKLITGTNRNKTLEEIISKEDIVEGWISIHTVGVDALESVLCKLPENEDVFWSGWMMAEVTQENAITLTLPDDNTIKIIKAYAEICKLNLNVFPAP